jgi:uncharacterized protein (TIGR03089 family)
VAADLLSTVIIPPSREASAPCLTFLDPGTGERTELSGRTVALWVSKTANFVTDELALEPGEVLALRLPSHWQAWTWLFGAWHAGCTVALGEPGDPLPDDAAAAVLDRASATVVAQQPHHAELVSLALRPMALPGPPPPGGVLDYDTNVRAHGDSYRRPDGAAPGGIRTAAGTVAWPGLDTPKHLDDFQEGPGRRLLTSLSPSSPDAVSAVVRALAAGSSVVLLGGAGGAAVADASQLAALHLQREGITHVTGELSGLLT